MLQRMNSKVFLDYDQPGLDAAYDQAVHAPNLAQVRARFNAASDRVRERLGLPQRLQYGPTAAESLDLFTTRNAQAPVAVFVHGGAWRTGTAHNYAFLAEAFVRAGAHVAVLDFVSVDEARGDLRPMAEQVRRAIAWVHRHAGDWGGDAHKLHVLGHSSGAHLAAVAMLGHRDDAVVRSATLISGIYDLLPVRLSSRRSYLRISPGVEDALSPQRHVTRVHHPVVLGYGSLESPEFRRQTLDFAQALRAAGKDVTCIEAPHYNHFEVLEALCNPYGLYGACVLEAMGLGAAGS